LLPWLGLSAALGLTILMERLRLPAQFKFAVGIAVPLIWLALTTGFKDHADYLSYKFGNITATQWYARFEDNFSFNQCNQMATCIQRITTRDEYILVWGYDPLIYLLADRKAPTRFIMNIPLRVNFVSTGWHDEFLKDIATKKPAIILVANNDAFGSFGLNATSAQMLPGWTAYYDLINQYYTLQPRIASFDVYRINK
jgi:hypothetical protein